MTDLAHFLTKKGEGTVRHMHFTFKDFCNHNVTDLNYISRAFFAERDEISSNYIFQKILRLGNQIKQKHFFTPSFITRTTDAR